MRNPHGAQSSNILFMMSEETINLVGVLLFQMMEQLVVVFLWRGGTRNPLAPGQGSRPTLVSKESKIHSQIYLFFVARARPFARIQVLRIFIDGGWHTHCQPWRRRRVIILISLGEAATVNAKANTFMTIIRGGWLNLATRVSADTCRRRRARTLIDEAKKPYEPIADKRCKLVS